MSTPAHYNFIKRIHHDEVADYFLAVSPLQENFQKLCMIKQLAPAFETKPSCENLLRDEARCYKLLQHQNILNIYGFEKINRKNSIIMEFIDGSDLSYLLQVCQKSKIQFPSAVAAAIGAEISRALAFAWTRVDPKTDQPIQLAHGDLTPANIFISYEGEVKVTGFGVGKDYRNALQEVPTPVGREKIRYESPETVALQTANPQSDIFSLGVILWEMLAGEPFLPQIPREEQLSMLATDAKAKSLTTLNPSVDPVILEIIVRCLAPQPVDRPNSAQILESELSTCLRRVDPEFTPKKLGVALQTLLAKEQKALHTLIREALNKPNAPNNVQIDIILPMNKPIRTFDSHPGASKNAFSPIRTGSHKMRSTGIHRRNSSDSVAKTIIAIFAVAIFLFAVLKFYKKLRF